MKTSKSDNMSRVKIQQLKHESDTWKRELGFMMDENVLLKNRLSEVLKTKHTPQFLADAESFQNNFLRQDDVIRLLRNDISQFDKLLIQGIFEEGLDISIIEAKRGNIGRNISTAENQFDTLKTRFNSYLLENIE